MMKNLQPVFDAMLLSCAYCGHFVGRTKNECLSCILKQNMRMIVDELVEEKKLEAFELLPFED